MKKTHLIIETDLGHDPDDLFTILYLATVPNVQIDALLLTPGDKDQLALANLLREVCLPGAKIGVAKESMKKSVGGTQKELLRKHYVGRLWNTVCDGRGDEVIRQTLRPGLTRFLVIGPATNLRTFLENYFEPLPGILMQGGFVPYSLYTPQVCLESFKQKETMPTFNMNGDPKAITTILTHPFRERYFVGKNVCHTILFTKERASQFRRTDQPAVHLFHQIAHEYFRTHNEKKLHDPTAAVCLLHPEIGVWLPATPIRRQGQWSSIEQTEESPNRVLVDIDRDKLWFYLTNWS